MLLCRDIPQQAPASCAEISIDPTKTSVLGLVAWQPSLHVLFSIGRFVDEP
jgi:hypothetical protein